MFPSRALSFFVFLSHLSPSIFPPLLLFLSVFSVVPPFGFDFKSCTAKHKTSPHSLTSFKFFPGSSPLSFLFSPRVRNQRSHEELHAFLLTGGVIFPPPAWIQTSNLVQEYKAPPFYHPYTFSHLDSFPRLFAAFPPPVVQILLQRRLLEWFLWYVPVLFQSCDVPVNRSLRFRDAS